MPARIALFVGLMCLGTGLVGCGGTSTPVVPAKSEPLTDAQKAEFKAQLDTVNDAELAEQKRQAAENAAAKGKR